jgi:GNAT superfamily N-acetyltransferase
LTALGTLVGEAMAWLQTSKHTDQWAKPWPTREARDQRLRTGVEKGRTWIVWDGDVPAATVTVATRANTAVWSNPACGCDLSEPAVYAHRLITARRYSGRGLGAELLDWTGLRGRRLCCAHWIRIDVWSSNTALHDYYLNAGFQRCGNCADPDYPSGALFQKPVSAIREPRFPKFIQSPASVGVSANLDLAPC